MVVPLRHVLLGVLATLVVVGGVYLFIEVRATSAGVTPAASHVEAKAPPPPVEADSARTGEHRWTAPKSGGMSGSSPRPVVAPAQEDESTDDTIAALERANPKLDAIMDQANKHYDKGEFEDAKAIAGKVLSQQPTNIRMMRIMVSSSCVDGDQPVAQKWFEHLPKPDREQMKVRCAKYEVTFKDPPQ
ncbi:MAG: hypothetical protein ABI591_32785 [Kofleriaceae bacterium]